MDGQEVDGAIILFDGVCNLCSRSVQFVLKHDKAGRFRFASLQGDAGQGLLKQHGLSGSEFNSFILLESDKVYTRSTAALRVAKGLGGGWKLLYIFRLVPRLIRDGVYDWVSRNRYRWFGQREACWVPSEKWKGRFLD